MKQNIIYIGLDVDDTQYHGSAFNKDTGEVIDFKCRPTLRGLLQQHLRTAIIEANQRGYRTARIGKDVKAKRKDIAPELIHIADRCLRRLNKKGNRLLLAGKHRVCLTTSFQFDNLKKGHVQ